tara:strand:- start:104 stop:802 length:699 start_codon:yes stop_codon:yes gene_type:complete
MKTITTDKLSYIRIYNDVLSDEFCEDLIHKFESDPNKSSGRVGGESGIDTDIKQSTDLVLHAFDKYQDECTQLFNVNRNCIQHYLEYLVSFTPTNTPFINEKIVDSGFQMQRTEPDQFYDWHDDSNVQEYFSERGLFHRFFTYIFYLNDIDMSNDGYTEFLDGTRVQPKRGRLVYFPSNWCYKHRGVAPRDQTKYIVTGWMGNLHDEYQSPMPQSEGSMKGQSVSFMGNDFD